MSVWYHERLDILAYFFCTVPSIYADALEFTGWIYMGEFD